MSVISPTNLTPVFYQGKEEIAGLQVLKLICAILVVQLHYYSFAKDIMLPLCGIAVPVFFIISGYFILDGYGVLHRDKLKRTFAKISKLTLVAYVIYMIFFMAFTALRHEELFAVTYLRLGYWVRVVILGEAHLWYLTAFMQAIIVFWLVANFWKNPTIYLLIPVGLAINLMLGRYIFLWGDYDFPIYISRNVVTVAIPCLLIGMAIRRYEHQLPSEKWILLSLFVVMFGLYFESWTLDRYFPVRNGDILLLTVPAATLVFMAFLRLRVESPLGLKLAEYGRLYSLDIYVWHIMIGMIVVWICFKTGLRPVEAFIVMAFALIAAVILKKTNLKRAYA